MTAIRLEMSEGIALVTFDRPERRNAFNEEMWENLEAVTAKLREGKQRAVVVTGAGDKAFSAGFDINPDNPQVASLVDSVQKHERGPAEALIRRIQAATRAFVTLPVPVIAALNGLAYGGGAEFAVQCDMRVMDPDAVISFSEARLGLMPDWGGGVGLARLVGPSKAADMILTARTVDAREALAMGLVNRVSAPGRALDEALELARAIAKNGPRAVRNALDLIRSVPDLTVRDALALEMERAVDLIASGECVHGITAFLSKKEPEWPE